MVIKESAGVDVILLKLQRTAKVEDHSFFLSQIVQFGPNLVCNYSFLPFEGFHPSLSFPKCIGRAVACGRPTFFGQHGRCCWLSCNWCHVLTSWWFFFCHGITLPSPGGVLGFCVGIYSPCAQHLSFSAFRLLIVSWGWLWTTDLGDSFPKTTWWTPPQPDKSRTGGGTAGFWHRRPCIGSLPELALSWGITEMTWTRLWAMTIFGAIKKDLFCFYLNLLEFMEFVFKPTILNQYYLFLQVARNFF